MNEEEIRNMAEKEAVEESYLMQLFNLKVKIASLEETLNELKKVVEEESIKK